MRVEKQVMEQEIEGLLLDWCNALVGLQLDLPDQPAFDGGILCPACKLIHGRCHDAVYPLLCMADRTGKEAYLRAAKKLFSWGENMLCDDGSLYNDAQSSWNGITVFNAVSLHDALSRHGRLLSAAERGAWEDRLRRMGEWLYRHLVVGMATNINYFAANACAMALLGKYFGRKDYLALARTLAGYCREHLSENRLLFGEGRPNDGRSPKGCRAVDVGGYNVEESLPSLCRYAWETGDADALEAFAESYRAHLAWMLPDGAWDNSVGTRTFKWTYWGSRTSDGCQEALFRLGRTDPVFAEAAWRNLMLYRRCTHDGLLSGGPDYRRHGEPACVHHTFCHAKVLSAVLDEGAYSFERQELPSDAPEPLRYYPEVDTCRIAAGGWRADVTGYDFHYMRGGHTSGGAVSLLWNTECGPVIAAGMTDYSMHEVHNQQLSRKKAEHRCTSPRIEMEEEGKRWGQHYDYASSMRAEQRGEGVCIHVDASLCDEDHRRRVGDSACTLEYHLTESGLAIHGAVPASLAEEAEYILPIMSGRARVTVLQGTLAGEPEPMFSLNPGLMGREFRVRPDEGGRFALEIRL